jgi:hypothetical protein
MQREKTGGRRSSVTDKSGRNRSPEKGIRHGLTDRPHAVEGYTAGPIHFISDDKIAYACGNGIR